jgi:murein DD-endopeptidase MepM/ murein hydrolase activator NlpD
MAGTTIPKGGSSVVDPNRLQVGPATSRVQPAPPFQETLAEAARRRAEVPEENPPPQEHTVRPGDTLSEIVAAQFVELGSGYTRRDVYDTVKQVAAANGLANPDRIFPGQKIDLAGVGNPLAGPLPGAARQAAAQLALNHPPPQNLQPPATGRITSFFGRRNHPLSGLDHQHTGIDIGLPTGTSIKPIAPGVVTFAGQNGGYGQLVEIDHGNGLTSRYAHLSELLVSVGEEIGPEHILGHSGRTGISTGPHLHLEIRRQDKPINPLILLSRQEIEGGSLLARARSLAKR